MNRHEGDAVVAVRETKSLQEQFDNNVKRRSFDRGFHSPENQAGLSELVNHLCLPKPGAKQSVVQQSEADDEFRAAQLRRGWSPGFQPRQNSTDTAA